MMHDLMARLVGGRIEITYSDTPSPLNKYYGEQNEGPEILMEWQNAKKSVFLKDVFYHEMQSIFFEHGVDFSHFLQNGISLDFIKHKIKIIHGTQCNSEKCNKLNMCLNRNNCLNKSHAILKSESRRKHFFNQEELLINLFAENTSAEEIKELMHNDSTFNACFKMLLMEKITLYECIVLMTKQNIAQTKDFKEILELNPHLLKIKL